MLIGRHTSSRVTLPVAVAMAALGILLAGCGSDDDVSEDAQFAHSSYAAIFDYDDLLADAALVAVVHGTGVSTREEVGQAPYAITEVTVTQVIAGSEAPTITAGQTILVRQLAVGPAEASVVTDQTEYLLFLTRFEWEPGRPTEQYIPLGGDQGVFVETDGSSSGERQFRVTGTERPIENPAQVFLTADGLLAPSDDTQGTQVTRDQG
jgi:hypothetical protein